VATGETLPVALTVDGSVLGVASLELLYRRLDGPYAILSTSSDSGDVGV
jgi:hypothetical protein